jgi:ABC-type spermidine/putrescine transport system permease subunit II
MSSETVPEAPVPSATMVITAATPMVIPSIVSAVRILFLFRALIAIRKLVRSI